MKISLNWLKKYVNIPSDVSNEELIRLIGSRLVEVEGVIDETYKYDNIYIVRVESCEKIPETHLTLCKINVGMAELVQVVCGAPNVREGMLAVWIAPGATVPASVHEDAPFVIGKRKMQGYESCGMLAGADELDFGDDHSGIVEIEPETAKPGDLLADVFELNDLVLEIENKSLTHRPDCFGMIGFAREVAGILGLSFIEPVLSSTELKSAVDSFDKSDLKISIEHSDICPRYSAVVMEKHGDLKKKYLTWVDTVLSKSGMKPINPIVDATNYLMLLTGQPLHAFDYDKFVKIGGASKPDIQVRLARGGEKLALLDETEVELNENDIVICSGEKPVALAGAMGGESTMIDENTRNIIIESATFSLYNLRKTQMAHGIFTEAITRFTKGQPPYQTMDVASACAEILSDGFQVVTVGDEYPKPEKQIVVKITTGEINRLLGTMYSPDLIIGTLGNVGFRVTSGVDVSKEFSAKSDEVSAMGEIVMVRPEERLEIVVPNWRMDIHIKEDIIEEVGRLLGYDNIEPILPLHATANKNSMWELKKKIRESMFINGANEVLTYSFVSERLIKKVGQDINNSYKIVNSISPELQYIRQSIVPSLLEKAYINEKLPVERFAVFEINKVYPKNLGVNSEKVPNEKMSLGFVVAERKGKNTAFYLAKKYAAKLFEELNILIKIVPMKGKMAEEMPFEPKRSAEIFVGEQYVGVVGELKNSVRNEFKLAPFVAGFEIDVEKILEFASHKKQIDFAEKKTEDLTVTTEKTYAETFDDVRKQYPDAIITPGVIYQAPGQKSKNMTFHIENKVSQ